MSSFGRTSPRFDGGLFAFFVLLGVLAFAGGSSRNGEPGQLVSQLAAIAAGLGAVISRVTQGGRSLRGPFWTLAALTGLMLLQLVPLPPALWTLLPGRAIFVDMGVRAGVGGTWRPISISPDATVAAALGMLPAFAALIAMATVPRDRIWWVIHGLGICIVLSAVIGLAQIITGGTGPLYFYRVTNFHVATGLLANRNHAGLFLALGLPLIGALLARAHARSRRAVPAIAMVGAGGAVVLLLVALLATGSRAGLLVGAIGLGAGLALARAALSASFASVRTLRPAIVVAIAVVVAATLGLLATSSWETITRLRALNVASDGRAILFWPNFMLGWSYFPAGIGFGAFPQAFRIVEPFDNLSLSYLNHAHNDWLEIVIEGGVAAIALVVGVATWAVRSLATIRRVPDAGTRAFGWLGAVWMVMIVVASAFDYPLRTPLIATVWVVAMASLTIAAAGRSLGPPAR